MLSATIATPTRPTLPTVYQTTIKQRSKLFEIWSTTGSVAKACQLAGVSRSTFYYWKDRFQDGGYDALVEVASHAPKNPLRVASEIADEIADQAILNPDLCLTNGAEGSRLTSTEQRNKLFEVWSESGSVIKACQEAGVSRSTFYYWRKRFLEGGYDALAEVRSHAPENPRRIAPEIAKEVVELKRANPTWGKRRISRHIEGKHGWRMVSPNTVRRVLMDEGMW